MKENVGSIKQQLQELMKKSNSALQNTKNRQKVVAYMYLILSLFSLSFFGIFAIRPTVSTISKLKKQLAEDKLVLEALKKKNTALQVLGEQYTLIASSEELITNAIPESPRIPELTRKLETLSNKNNLEVTKLDVGLIELYPAKKTNPPIFSYTFSITVRGEENDINTFISQLVTLERIVTLDRITTGKAQEDKFAASVTGRAFFYKSIELPKGK